MTARKMKFGEVLEHLMKQAGVDDFVLGVELGTLPLTIEAWRRDWIEPPSCEMVKLIAEVLEIDPERLLVALPKETRDSK